MDIKEFDGDLYKKVFVTVHVVSIRQIIKRRKYKNKTYSDCLVTLSSWRDIFKPENKHIQMIECCPCSIQSPNPSESRIPSEDIPPEEIFLENFDKLQIVDILECYWMKVENIFLPSLHVFVTDFIPPAYSVKEQIPNLRSFYFLNWQCQWLRV